MADRRKKKPAAKKPAAKKPAAKRPAAKKPAAKPAVTRAPAEGLARRKEEALVPRTEAEWSRFVDDVVDDANRGVRRSGLEHEGVADQLFKDLFGRDVEAGLDPETHATEAFRRVAERAGASLRMYYTDFVTHVRIGALNQHRHDGAWLDLDWSKKVLLAPLLDLPEGMEKLKEGVALAGQPNVGVRHLREWLYALVPKKAGAVGRPRNDGLTVSSGGKFAQTGVQLKSEHQRKAFIKRLAKAPPEKRRELVKDLRDALEGLAALVEEIDALE